MRFSACCCAALAMLLPAGISRANVASQIDYYRDQTAAHCPDEAELRKAVAARLGYDPFVEWSPRRIVVEINEADSNRLSATIALVEGNGIIKGRSVVTAVKQDCAELASSIALTIAIALDPDKVLLTTPSANPEPPPIEAAQPPEQPAPPPVVPVKPVPTVKSTPAPRPRHWLVPAVRLSGYRLANVVPATSWGLRLGASFTHAPFVGIVELFADAPNSDTLQRPYLNVRSHLFGGDLLPCVKFQWLSLCGSVRTANAWFRLQVAERNQDARFLHLAVGGRAELALEFLRNWSVIANLDGHRTVTPASLGHYSSTVWVSPVATYSVGLGFQRSFL